MIVLYIYIATTLLSVGINVLVLNYCDKEAENMGYKWKEEKNIYKLIMENIKFYSFLCIPFLNIVASSIVFFKAEEFTKEIIDEAIKTGDLVKKEDEHKTIEQFEVDNNLVEDAKVVVYKVEDKEKKELTRAEKIEFLREEYKRLTGEEVSNNTKGKQRGIGKRRL